MNRTLVSLAALALLAGCGSPDPAPAAPSPPPTSAPPASPSPPSEAARKVRLAAAVLAPADDSGCVEVRSDVGVRWALRGPGLTDLAAGDLVDVVGSPRPGGGGCEVEAVLAVTRLVVTG